MTSFHDRRGDTSRIIPDTSSWKEIDKTEDLMDPGNLPGGLVVKMPLPMQGAQVPSMVGEIRYHMPCGMAKTFFF